MTSLYSVAMVVVVGCCVSSSCFVCCSSSKLCCFCVDDCLLQKFVRFIQKSLGHQPKVPDTWPLFELNALMVFLVTSFHFALCFVRSQSLVFVVMLVPKIPSPVSGKKLIT